MSEVMKGAGSIGYWLQGMETGACNGEVCTSELKCLKPAEPVLLMHPPSPK